MFSEKYFSYGLCAPYGLTCSISKVDGKEANRKEGERERGMTYNKGPLPELNHGCCNYVACVGTHSATKVLRPAVYHGLFDWPHSYSEGKSWLRSITFYFRQLFSSSNSLRKLLSCFNMKMASCTKIHKEKGFGVMHERTWLVCRCSEFNIIQNLWVELEHQLQAWSYCPTSIDDLTNAI